MKILAFLKSIGLEDNLMGENCCRRVDRCFGGPWMRLGHASLGFGSLSRNINLSQ